MTASRVMTRTAIAFCAALLVASNAPADPPAKVALTGGRIIPVSGEDLDQGTVLIEHGRITAVGADVEIPYDAIEIDCTGRVIMPGMIDPHSWGGLDVANENLAVAPFLDVYDAIDPSRLSFEEALRDGITTMHVIQGNNCVIGGISRVVHPIGMRVDDMTQAEDVALKLSASPKGGYDRMRQLAELRETFVELDEYLERIAETKYEETLAKRDEEIDVGPEEASKRGAELIDDDDYDDRHRNLVRLRRGEIGAWIYCNNATDVGPAITLATDQGFLERTVLVLGGETVKAIRQIERAGRPVVLPPDLYYRERDELTGEIDETFLPKIFHDAGITFALQPNSNASMAERYLNYQAAVCVRNGIPRGTALESITIRPARMLGLGDDLGSIEPGKIANLTIMSGDPLDFDSWVDLVFINGVLAYDRARDERLKELMGLHARYAERDASPPADDAQEEAEGGAEEGEGADAAEAAPASDATGEAGGDETGGAGEGDG